MIIRKAITGLWAIIAGVAYIMPLPAVYAAQGDSRVSAGPAPQGVSSVSAGQVMVDVDERYEGDTRRQTGVLTLIDKEGNRRVREFREFSKKYGEDEKRISFVISPPEVEGTAFMSYEWKDRDREDEAWLYLPQLRKVKRLASTDKSSYFLGSDFTYADFIGLEVEDFDYRFADEESGESEWVIIATPREDITRKVIDETGYKKVKYWVDRRKLIITKAQYWLNEGHRVKYYSASEIEEIDGIWTVQRMQMVMTQGSNLLHASVFQLSNIEHNKPIDDKMFTTYAMEREAN